MLAAKAHSLNNVRLFASKHPYALNQDVIPAVGCSQLPFLFWSSWIRMSRGFSSRFKLKKEDLAEKLPC